ncbi:hypothetical protein D3C86_2058630 [compost metagenome]
MADVEIDGVGPVLQRIEHAGLQHDVAPPQQHGGEHAAPAQQIGFRYLLQPQPAAADVDARFQVGKLLVADMDAGPF